MSDPVLLPDEYYREIGKVAVHWSALEMLLNKALIRMLGKSFYEGPSHIVFAHMAFPQKMDVLSALIKEFGGAKPEHPISSYFSATQPLFKTAASVRNKVIHSFYTKSDEGIFAISLKARGKLELLQSPQTLTDLALGVHAISEAGYSLKSLVDALPDAPD